jgi:hypothetical protein
VKLTDEVLALHDGIRQVLILEDRNGEFVVTEKATKYEISKSPYDLEEATENAKLAPALILGAAGQFQRIPGSLKLVGILYRNEGRMLTYLDEGRLLEIHTEPSSLYDAMRMVNETLPNLIKEHGIRTKGQGAIKSAAEAENIARTFIARTKRSTRVLINAISFRATDSRWEVKGYYSSTRLSRSKDFQLEMAAEDGTIVSFLSSSPRLQDILFAVELFALIAALSLLGWLLYSNLLRR